MKPFVVLLCWLSVANALQAQEFKQPLKDSATYFAIEPIFCFERQMPSTNKSIHLPSSIRNLRSQAANSTFDGTFGNAPQFHFSSYAGAAFDVSPKSGYHFNLSLIAEDRAGSFGVLRSDNFVIFPRMNITIKDSILLGKMNKPLFIDFKIGDMVNYWHRNGLALYNVDVQGGYFALSYGVLEASFTSITDLSQHVGIGVGEVFAYGLGLNHEGTRWRKRFGWAVDIIPESFYTTSPFIHHIYTEATHLKKHYGFVAELGYRYHQELTWFGIPVPNEPNQKLAGVLELFHQMKSDVSESMSLSLKNNVGLRYYGSVYNKRRTSEGSRYRNGAAFTGDFLYPLNNTRRQFDQWAVYTEFQDQNITSLNWMVKGSLQLLNKASIFSEHELLLLLPEKEPAFLYHFFRTGLSYKLTKNWIAEAYMSNSVMNLDAHYQTYYQARVPMFSFGIRTDRLY